MSEQSEVLFDLPKGMAGQEVAYELTSYLWGAQFTTASTEFPVARDGKWQLNSSNDYWFSVSEGGQGSLRCRYGKSNQGRVIQAMAELLRAKYGVA